MEYIGKISAIVEDSSTSNVILLGDFNADVDTLFETELMEMCDSLNLLISDYSIFGPSSGQYTRVSNAHNTTSWLDHIICSHDVQKKLVCINILDILPCSDHLPLCVSSNFNCDPIVTSTQFIETHEKQTNVTVLEKTSRDCIPSFTVDSFRDYIFPGFTEHVNELHTLARAD